MDDSIRSDMHYYEEIAHQLAANSAVLFLGSGSTRNCRTRDGQRGLSGQGLADECLKQLNGGKLPGFSATLTEAAEFYAAWYSRKELDQFVKRRLEHLQPTLGHFILASLPWRAVVTTNYNRVIEDAWGAAHGAGFARRELISIKVDIDITTHAAAEATRLYKPHGCVSAPEDSKAPMVLTSVDYFKSESVRPIIYTAIRGLADNNSTVFVGYSMADYTFRNIYYSLYAKLGQFAHRSFSVGPCSPETRRKWMERSMQEMFRTTVIDDAFDTFMLRLLRVVGRVHPELKKRIRESWPVMVSDNDPYSQGLVLSEFEALPDA